MKKAVVISQKPIGDSLFMMAVYTMVIVAIILVAYPVYFVIIASVSNPYQVINGRVWLWPNGFTLAGYERIFTDARIWIGYLNTILYTVVGTFFKLLFILPASYALANKRFFIRRMLLFYFVFTMFFSGGVIPLYLQIRSLNLYNTFWVMVLPFSIDVFYMLIARTFFQISISDELWDSAQIDGCPHTLFFLRIVIPLSKAIVAVVALYSIVGHWNEFMTAIYFLSDQNRMPLQIVLRSILISNVEDWIGGGGSGSGKMEMAQVIRYALIIVSTLPVLCFYPFIQKYFTKGVMLGAIKG